MLVIYLFTRCIHAALPRWFAWPALLGDELDKEYARGSRVALFHSCRTSD